jgi:elongation factor Ts
LKIVKLISIENYSLKTMAKEISAEAVQKLREITGAGVMDCRKALIEADGDVERAKAILAEKGVAKVEKRAGRETGAGLAYSYVHAERIGVLLEVRAETDFVVNSEPFRTLTRDLAMHIAAAAPTNVEELLAQPFIKDESKMVKDLVNEVIAKVGENVIVKQFYRIEV